MKEFLSSPKKTAILGLISCVIMLISMFRYINIYSILYHCCSLYFTGLTIYFVIVLIRMYKKKGNIKIANYILISTFIISIVSGIVLGIMEGESLFSLNELSLIIITIYLLDIIFIKKAVINNKFFAVVVFGVAIYEIIKSCMFIYDVGGIKYVNMSYLVGRFVQITIIPYFYNYYELLKEENKNGK